MKNNLVSRGVLALGIFVGVAAVAGAGRSAWMKFRRKPDIGESPAAAFAGTGAHASSFVHTRDAGPEHIRDEDGDGWDGLDQSSDESFPSSDPPSHGDFRAPKPIDYAATEPEKSDDA